MPYSRGLCFTTGHILRFLLLHGVMAKSKAHTVAHAKATARLAKEMQLLEALAFCATKTCGSKKVRKKTPHTFRPNTRMKCRAKSALETTGFVYQNSRWPLRRKNMRWRRRSGATWWL